MAQLMSVRLARNDACPWGFRLQGGKDFGAPLVIQKVNGGSPAERAGLQAGDAVIKVNNAEVFNLRHKEAQDSIVRAGNSFEITVQRGGSTWKPAVTPVGPSPVISKSPASVQPVTKTSLAANQPSPAPIGGGYNYSPAPFAPPQVNGSVPSVVNKQYNSPVGIYSEETIAETLSAQAEVLATGVLGVNFKKNEKNYDPSNSEVLKMLNEIANEPQVPEPEPASGTQYFSHSSHAIGGRATSPRPQTPIPASGGRGGVANNPQCSDCERTIVGGMKPAGAISAALAKTGMPAQHQPQPASPQPSTLGPVPFHAPGGVGARPFNVAPPQPAQAAPAPPFSAPAPPFSAPAPAPFSTAPKPAPAGGRFVWPPPAPADEISSVSTATPLYIPPTPSHFPQAPPEQDLPHQSEAPPHQSEAPPKSNEPSVAPFPQPYADFASHPPVSRPLSAYQYTPKSLNKSHVTFDEAATQETVEEAHKKFSVCSQEVQTFTERRSIASSVEQISESIDMAMMVSAMSDRPPSPTPASPVRHEDERQIVEALSEVIDRQSIEEVHQQSERIVEEFRNFASPVAHQQLTDASECFEPIPQEAGSELQASGSHSTLLPILVPDAEQSQMVAALSTAPDRPYTPLAAPAPPLKQAQPFPAQSEPYRTPDDRCASPMVSALTIAPQRPYSPFPAAVSVRSEEVVPTPLPPPPERPFDLPTPSHYSSMLSALTIAPERPYTPLVVTQAPTITSQEPPSVAPAQIPAKTQPSKIVDVQPEIYKPPVVEQAPLPPPPEPVVAPPPIVEAPPPPPIIQAPPPEIIAQPQSEPRNALNLQRETQRRPITPKIPRPVTPSSMTGLGKPATIPRYQRNIGDGDFPCRSPRPTTPSCPMTIPRAVTPLPHKQLEIVRAETPGWVYEGGASQSHASSKQSQQGQTVSSTTQNVSGGQVVVTKKTRVVEEFESSHKESSQVFETSGTSRKLVSSSAVSDSLAAQSQMVRRETAVFEKPSAPVVERKSSIAQIQEQLFQHQQEVMNFERKPSIPQALGKRQSIGQVQAIQQSQDRKASITQAAERKPSIPAVVQERKPSIPPFVEERKQSIPPFVEERKQSLPSFVEERKPSIPSFVEERKQSFSQAPQVPERRQSIPKVAAMMGQPQAALPIPRLSLAETQRASPLPFPNIDLPRGMTFEIVKDEALYQSGEKKQVYKIPGPVAWNAPQLEQRPQQPDQKPVPQPFKAPTPTFKAVAPSNRQPFVALMSPKFEPKDGFVPIVSQPTQTVATQPLQSFAIRPTQTVPPQQVYQPAQPSGTSFRPLVPPQQANQPCQPSGISFRPLAPQQQACQPCQPSGVSFRPIVPQQQACLPCQGSGVSFRPIVPQKQACQPSQPSGISFRPVAPRQPAASKPVRDVPPPLTAPPNAGAGPKGASFAGASAPVRGRGVLNQAQTGRIALCGSCNGNIRGPFVTALGKIWCPEHFVCVNPQCRRQLADIGFVEEKGQLYCEYCFEQFIAPPCAKCSNKIKGDCLNAVGKQYHPECFTCAYCGKLFGNNPFFLEDGLPYCQADWNELFTTKCFACGFPIEAGDRWVEALNNNYHSQCFNCTSCKKNLEGQSFFAKSGRPFCKAHAR